MNEKKIVILGAGISGLATAYWLNKKGFDVTILEAQSQVGGAMQTSREDGFLIDFGPNSGLETTPLIRQIVEEVGLSDEMIYASEISSKRYILRNDKLHELPMELAPFLKTKLFSVKGKLRLFGEPFIGKSADGYYQSIAQFVERRLGKEFLDYAIDPFVSGVFAGDPTKLSVKSAFPKLYRLEEIYGGLVKGMIKGARERKKRAEESKQSAKMFSFINGMQTFPKAIAKTLQGKITLECRVKSVERPPCHGQRVAGRTDKWQVKYEKNGQESNIDCDQIISTVPAYIAADIFGGLDAELSNHLNEIYYPPVMVLYVGFNKNDIGTPLDGFGFLIPSKEKKKFLGAIWSSTIFPNRSSDDHAAFTLFVGGARLPQLFAEEKDILIKNALSEFKSLMNIKVEPVILNSKIWQKAIPQYNLGYIEHENYFDKFEKENPGIFLSGNYRGGISVGDCVKNSELVCKRIMENLEFRIENWFIAEKIENYGNPVLEKSFSFGVRVVKFYSSKIKINYHYKDLFRQLLRSGTSIGDNITEAQEAASKKDFINKLSIALKEARETEYWLKLLSESSVIAEIEFNDLYNNCQELIRLLVSILKKLREE